VQPVYYSARKKRSKRKAVNIFLFVILSGTISLLARGFLFPKTDVPSVQGVTQLETPVALSSIPSPSPVVISTSLANAVQSALEGTHGNYGIVVKNLKTNESYFVNQDSTYDSASLYKLWVMATVYEKVKSGALTEDQVLSEDVQTLNEKFEIDPDLAEQTEGTVTYSVSDALNKMITVSDNYAALLLTEKIGLSSVAAWLKTNGFNNSKVGTNGEDPTTTPADIASFFEKLYKGQLTDKTFTDKMIVLLKAQALNGKIPKYLPDGIEIAHKTGELNDYTHDAGIIYTPSADYIIVILSQSDAPDLAEERIANVSQAVYNYFTKSE
jgi:beta-lactamase class A